MPTKCIPIKDEELQTRFHKLKGHLITKSGRNISDEKVIKTLIDYFKDE